MGATVGGHLSQIHRIPRRTEGRAGAFFGGDGPRSEATPTTHVEKRQVIDGQQRLTTLEIFLSAFRDFCRAQNCEDLGNECDGFTLNKGMMADPDVDKFKVWPTQADRSQFSDVVLAGSRVELEKKHPVVRRKFAREPDPRPRMVEAYLFFYGQISDFFLTGPDGQPTDKSKIPTDLEECFQSLKNALQVVVIDLEPGDDAQVIFETLNARGEPLLPTDLLRNFIFLRAGRQEEPQEALYYEFWRKFDEPFWREEIRQGRLSRPRSDLFMQHFLASKQMVDVPVRHLFVEYKHWIEKQHPFKSVREELKTLSRQGDNFRRLIDPQKVDPLYSLAMFLNSFDISTAYPLLLFLLDAALPSHEWDKIVAMLESYFVRGAVCGLSTKNYTRIVLALIKALNRDGVTAANVNKQLTELKGDSAEWPSDQALMNAWQNRNAYATLNNPKMVYVMKRLSDAHLGPKHEKISIDSPLTVEHIMPQDWIARWPLPDGSSGLTPKEMASANPGDGRLGATTTRHALVQTFGNLTILTQQLNSSVSNGPWQTKRPELLKCSLLPINQELHNSDAWDESAIMNRGQVLLSKALALWPKPVS
jgi:hypothetical protein